MPTVLGWRLAILFARKTIHKGICISDVTSNQSRYASVFAADVVTALRQLEGRSPETFQKAVNLIGQIARAEIRNKFEYFSQDRLLLLRVDYAETDLTKAAMIVDDFVELTEASKRITSRT